MTISISTMIAPHRDPLSGLDGGDCTLVDAGGSAGLGGGVGSAIGLGVSSGLDGGSDFSLIGVDVSSGFVDS